MTLPTMVGGLSRSDLLGWIRRIDAGPFSTLAVGERIVFPNAEILVTLAAAAAASERVRVAATLFVLPMHRAAWLAKQLATLDVLSGGRLVVGVGVGGREEDYRAVGAPFERRHARMDAQVRELRRLWSGAPALPGSEPIGPPPVRPGGPPLWIGAASEPALRRGARWAEGVVGFSLAPDPEEIARGFELARRAWREAGRAERPWLATSFWYALGAGAQERLRAYARRYLQVFGARPAEALAARCRAAGAPALREALDAARTSGADEVLLVPTSADLAELEGALDVLGGASQRGILGR
jgi:alkanesulfonate monooxygenase SsuD/methylene tetrahydromethanopterin reductase-like flavin-dependent oxidoreductase (luciferase family)